VLARGEQVELAVGHVHDEHVVDQAVAPGVPVPVQKAGEELARVPRLLGVGGGLDAGHVQALRIHLGVEQDPPGVRGPHQRGEAPVGSEVSMTASPGPVRGSSQIWGPSLRTETKARVFPSGLTAGAKALESAAVTGRGAVFPWTSAVQRRVDPLLLCRS
jgi:hypothetical protein